MDNPAPWLPDASWDNITELDKLANFHGIITSFEQYPRDWNIWFTSAEPEQAGLPGKYKVYATVHTQTNRGRFVKSVWMCRYCCMSIFSPKSKAYYGFLPQSGSKYTFCPMTPVLSVKSSLTL